MLAVQLMAGAMNITAALLVLAYNYILQQGVPEGAGTPHAAGRIYLVSALLVAGYLRRRSVKRRVLPYLAEPTEERLRKLYLFPLEQALSSLACWFLAIPIIGFVSIQANGAVHPIRFPHFCLSIFFAALFTCAYSTTFHTLLVCALTKSSRPPRIACIARVTPWVALLIPIVAGFLFFSFERPAVMSVEAYLRLERLFSILTALSGYAWVICDFLSRRIRQQVPTSV